LRRCRAQERAEKLKAQGSPEHRAEAGGLSWVGGGSSWRALKAEAKQGRRWRFSAQGGAEEQGRADAQGYL